MVASRSTRIGLCTLVVGCAVIGSAASATNAAVVDRALVPMRVTPQRVTIPVTVMPLRRANSSTNYAGTLTTVPGSSGGFVGAAYDPQNQSYYLIGGEILDQLQNGKQTQIGNFFSLGYPASIVWDAHSQLLYVSIPSVYAIYAVTTAGSVSLLAGGQRGTSDGTGSAAQFQNPTGLTLDPTNDIIYVFDSDRLRSITEGGAVTTIGPTGVFTAGGASISFDGESGVIGLAAGAFGGVALYDFATNVYKTIAGRCILGQFPNPCAVLHEDGHGHQAFFGSLNSITYDPASNAFYVADGNNFDLRKVDLQGNVTTFAGSGAPTIQDGVGLAASFAYPECTTLDPDTQSLVVCDAGALRLATLSGPPAPVPSNAITMQATRTLISTPSGITTTPDGSVWYAEKAPGYIARIFPSGKTREFALPARYSQPYDLSTDASGDVWFVNGYGSSQFGQPTSSAIGRMSPTAKVAEALLNGRCSYSAESVNSLAPDATGDMWFAASCPSLLGVIDSQFLIRQFTSVGVGALTIAPDQTLWGASGNELVHYNQSGLMLGTFSGVEADSGIAWGSDGNVWFLSNNYNTIGKLDIANGKVTEYQLPSCNCNFGGRGLGNLRAGADGALWFTEGYVFGSEWFYGGLGRVSTSGVFSEYRTYEPRSQPTGIAFTPAGVAWTSDGGADKVGHL